jgi:hypothetical protein
MSEWKNTPAWKDIDIPAESLPPGVKKIIAIITELDPKHAPRYASQADLTFCNIFVTDVVKAYRVVAPRHWVTSKGEPATMGRGIELSANKLVKWFEEHGGTYGWMEADEESARAAAARGHLVVVGWFNPDTRRRPGHVAILRADGMIAQAGAKNFEAQPLTFGFGDKPVRFWVQMEHGSHTP